MRFVIHRDTEKRRVTTTTFRALLRNLPAHGLVLLCLLTLAPPAWGELSAGQIAILVNRNSKDGLAVAQHYAGKRGIPAGHIIQLDLPLEDTLSRDDYEYHLARPTRRILEERRLAGTIRALVTTYAMPLRVAAPRPTDQHQRWAQDAKDRQKQSRHHLEALEELIPKLAADAPNASPPNTSDSKSPSSSAKAADPLLERVATAMRDAGARLSREQDRAKAEKETQELTRYTGQFGGMATLLQNLRPAQGADPEKFRTEIDKLRRQVAAAEFMIRLLNDAPTDLNRQRAYRLTGQVFGLRGVLALATAEMEAYSFKDGDAALDSELSLLWWDEGLYRIAGRIPNPLHFTGNPSAKPQPPPLPVLMVSRLDAPTPQLAMQMVDQALVAERSGLSGKVYIDARGTKPGQTFSMYAHYDQNLRDMAAMFRLQTSYDVVLDDTDRRFSSPGEAPDAAVYVGWYRLRAYEDAFTFKPGAIGYHIASSEAVSIHDPNEPGWCKNALERGITVTLGPTGEPYLDSFPQPKEFLGLLLTGRYSLVEAYYLTTRYISWRMALFGDPLYNPWRGKGPGGDTLAGLPVAPSESPFTDPVQAGRRLREQRETALAQVDRFMEQLEQRGRDPSSLPRP